MKKTSKTFEELAGRKLTEEEKAKAGRNLVKLARALKPTKLKPTKKEEGDESKSD